MSKTAAETDKQEVKTNPAGLKTAGTTDGRAKGKQAESEYTAGELAADAEMLFATRPECVLAALREKEITKCTKERAEKIVRAFMKREVK